MERASDLLREHYCNLRLTARSAARVALTPKQSAALTVGIWNILTKLETISKTVPSLTTLLLSW